MIDTIYSKNVADATNFLEYAEKHELALFPCAAGTKRPVLPWQKESSFERQQWVNWVVEGHNLAIDCAKSGLIVVDVDCSKVARQEAWQAYHDLCVSCDSPVVPAMTQSARGGWHMSFKRPADLAATDLRGSGTLVKISDVRALTNGELDGEVVGFKNRGYVVAPGSHFDGKPYLAMPNAPAPHECPAGLIEMIRLPVVEATYTGQGGTSDKADVAKLVAELDVYGEFSVEPDWFRYMGAIKLALGDTEEGVEVARQMTRDDATEEAFLSRWKRLASVDDGAPNRCRVGSMIYRYEELTGKKFHVRKSTQAMFSGVALSAVSVPKLPPLPHAPSPSLAPAGVSFLTMARPAWQHECCDQRGSTNACQTVKAP
jgi:hypothetical protein